MRYRLIYQEYAIYSTINDILNKKLPIIFCKPHTNGLKKPRIYLCYTHSNYNVEENSLTLRPLWSQLVNIKNFNLHSYF